MYTQTTMVPNQSGRILSTDLAASAGPLAGLAQFFCGVLCVCFFVIGKGKLYGQDIVATVLFYCSYVYRFFEVFSVFLANFSSSGTQKPILCARLCLPIF